MAIPQTPAVQVPTKGTLTAQLQQLIVTRAGLKEQVEMIEKQIPTIQAMLQLLATQEEAAKQHQQIQPEVTQD